MGSIYVAVQFYYFETFSLPVWLVWVIVIFSEWASDCCLTPIQQFFSYIMARTS